MAFSATVIALHTCYILVPIALSLLLLGNTFPRSGVLRGTLTYLSWLVCHKKAFLPLYFLPLVINATFGGTSDFWCSSSISSCLEMESKVFIFPLWAINYEKLRQSSVSGRAWSTFRACLSSGMSWPAALWSRTMPLKVRSCLVIGHPVSSWNCIHFKRKVCNLVADVWPNRILSRSHMSLAVGQSSNPPKRSSCMHDNKV